MMLQTLIATTLLLLAAFIGFGIGVLLLGKKPKAGICGTVPEVPKDYCPSQKAGICPIENTSPEVRMTHRMRINRGTEHND